MLPRRDQRYLKLVRFLLDGKGIDVVASVPPSGAADAAGGEAADVVVIGTGDMLAEGLRPANVYRARRPEATVVLVGERAEERSPVGMRVYEKLDETEGVVAAVEARSRGRPERGSGFAAPRPLGTAAGGGIVVEAVKPAERWQAQRAS